MAIHVAYYGELQPLVVRPACFEEKSEQIACFIEDYQKTLKETCQKSDDDVEKLLCFKLYRVTSLYTKQMTKYFDEAFAMSDQDITQDRLKDFIDGLKKEKERRENKIKI